LAENFRLLSNLVAFVNLLFEQIMGYELENEFEVRYDPLIKGRSNNASGNIELLLGSETQNEHQLIAARIHHMIDTEVTVWERNNMGEIERPIRYSDIAVLIRNRTHLPQIESQFIRAEIPTPPAILYGISARMNWLSICGKCVRLRIKTAISLYRIGRSISPILFRSQTVTSVSIM
jgi:superfamily I DNA/RNA helicase